jgi:hypothetical protein
MTTQGTKEAKFALLAQVALVPQPPGYGARLMSLLQLFRQVLQRRQPSTSRNDDGRDRSSMAELVRALERADREDAQRNDRH